MFNQEFMKTNSKFVANLFKSCGLLVPFVVVSCGENPEKNQDLQDVTLMDINNETGEKQQTTTKTTKQQTIAENDEVQEKKEEQQPIKEEIEDEKQEEVKEGKNAEAAQTAEQPSTVGGDEVQGKKEDVEKGCESKGSDN